jgi:hypothetical protein
VNRRKPLVQTPVVSRYPAPAPVHDFVLLFLPPCGPHLTPLATGSLESGLLVSLLLGGPARHRPFAPTLHLHQRKSSRNLHLQYWPRVSPHHVANHSSQPGATIHRSSDAPVLSRTPLNWSQAGERTLFGPKLVQEAEEKVAVIRENLIAAQMRQKSYHDKAKAPQRV